MDIDSLKDFFFFDSLIALAPTDGALSGLAASTFSVESLMAAVSVDIPHLSSMLSNEEKRAVVVIRKPTLQPAGFYQQKEQKMTQTF